MFALESERGKKLKKKKKKIGSLFTWIKSKSFFQKISCMYSNKGHLMKGTVGVNKTQESQVVYCIEKPVTERNWR